MKSIDEKIKEALNQEFNEIISNNEKIDSSVFKQIKSGFSGKMKWLNIQLIIYGFIFFSIMLYGIYCFYHEQDTKSLIGWAIVIIITALLSQLMKLWFWSEMGKNRIIREIKLLELQLAKTQSEQNKS